LVCCVRRNGAGLAIEAHSDRAVGIGRDFNAGIDVRSARLGAVLRHDDLCLTAVHEQRRYALGRAGRYEELLLATAGMSARERELKLVRHPFDEEERNGGPVVCRLLYVLSGRLLDGQQSKRQCQEHGSERSQQPRNRSSLVSGREATRPSAVEDRASITTREAPSLGGSWAVRPRLLVPRRHPADLGLESSSDRVITRRWGCVWGWPAEWPSAAVVV
jgi:hypothetical protein